LLRKLGPYKQLPDLPGSHAAKEEDVICRKKGQRWQMEWAEQEQGITHAT